MPGWRPTGELYPYTSTARRTGRIAPDPASPLGPKPGISFPGPSCSCEMRQKPTVRGNGRIGTTEREVWLEPGPLRRLRGRRLRCRLNSYHCLCHHLGSLRCQDPAPSPARRCLSQERPSIPRQRPSGSRTSPSPFTESEWFAPYAPPQQLGPQLPLGLRTDENRS